MIRMFCTVTATLMIALGNIASAEEIGPNAVIGGTVSGGREAAILGITFGVAAGTAIATHEDEPTPIAAVPSSMARSANRHVFPLQRRVAANCPLDPEQVPSFRARFERSLPGTSLSSHQDMCALSYPTAKVALY